MVAVPISLVKLARSARGTTGAETRELKIGELAKATGKTQRALRLYEELGLLTPDTRTQGNFRVYEKTAIERVRWITKLQDLGFTLQQIQELVAATAHEEIPREAMGRVRQLFHAKLDDVATQIERLSQLQRELVASLSYLEACGGCGQEAEGASQCQGCTTHEEAAPDLVGNITTIAAHSTRATPRDA
jgi:MerR family transcriptional regulator, copper efflux regulator